MGIEVVRVLAGAKVAPQQVTLGCLQTKDQFFFPQFLTKDQEAGGSTATIHPDMVEKERLKVHVGSCSKAYWRHFFEAAGDAHLLIHYIESL